MKILFLRQCAALLGTGAWNALVSLQERLEHRVGLIWIVVRIAAASSGDLLYLCIQFLYITRLGFFCPELLKSLQQIIPQYLELIPEFIYRSLLSFFELLGKIILALPGQRHTAELHAVQQVQNIQGHTTLSIIGPEVQRKIQSPPGKCLVRLSEGVYETADNSNLLVAYDKVLNYSTGKIPLGSRILLLIPGKHVQAEGMECGDTVLAEEVLPGLLKFLDLGRGKHIGLRPLSVGR